MHACAAILDEVLALARLEAQALADEDMEAAEELAGKRGGLLMAAWAQRDGFDADALRGRLLEVESMQKELQEALESLRAKLLAERAAMRKQNSYFDGDRYMRAERQRSYYCNTVS